jgi:ribosomal-protein-alanine N-acetyltransferase
MRPITARGWGDEYAGFFLRSMIPLETDRLRIRALASSDVPVLIALWMDPEVTRYMGGPRERARLEQVYEEELRLAVPPRYTLWPVVERTTGRVIGECGLIQKEVEGRQELELVYVLARDAWGRGYATEAAAAVRDAAEREGITRLIALIDPENPASARVACKIGMQLEREVIRPGGAIRQVYAMALGQGKPTGTA